MEAILSSPKFILKYVICKLDVFYVRYLNNILIDFLILYFIFKKVIKCIYFKIQFIIQKL